MTYEEKLRSRLTEILRSVVDEPDMAAYELVNKFGTLDRIFSASLRALSEIEPLGSVGASYVKLLAEVISRGETDKFKFGIKHTDEQRDAYLRALLAPYDVEVVYIMCLDKSRRTIGVDLVSHGVVNASELLPRKIVEAVIRRGASYVVLAHNHPNGVARLSAADMEATVTVDRTLAASGIKLIRHVVTAGNTSDFFDLEAQYDKKTI